MQFAKNLNKVEYLDVRRAYIDLLLGADDTPIDEFEFTDTEEQVYDEASAMLEDSADLARFIPPVPSQLIALLEELRNEDTDFDRIAKIIKSDLALVGEVIRTSNSPLYRRRLGTIDSIEQAIAFLGLEGISKVATVVLMRRVMDIHSKRYRDFGRALWVHCVKCSEGCRLISDGENTYTNFLLGLMHDVGKVVICNLMEEIINENDNLKIDEKKIFKLLIIEQSSFISASVASQWGLPDMFVKILEDYDVMAVNALMDGEHSERMEATKILDRASIASKVHTFIHNGTLPDPEPGQLLLQEIGLNVPQIRALFYTFETVEQVIP